MMQRINGRAHLHGRRMVCEDLGSLFGGNDTPAPDYTPMANASKESAEIMAQLGRDQLDESRRQYRTNLAIAAPVVDQQLQAGKINMQTAVDDRNLWQATARPVMQGLYAQMLGDETPISYYGYRPTQQIAFDPNADGPAQRAAKAAASGVSSAIAAPAPAAAYAGPQLIQGQDGRFYKQTVAPGEANPFGAPGSPTMQTVEATPAEVAAWNGRNTASPVPAAGVSSALSAKNPNAIIGNTFYFKDAAGNQRAYHVGTNDAGATTLYDAKGNAFATYDPQAGFQNVRKGTEGIVNAFLSAQKAGPYAADKAVGSFATVKGADGSETRGNIYYNGSTPLHVTRNADGTTTLTNAAGAVVAQTVKTASGSVVTKGNAGLMRQFESDTAYLDKQTADKAKAGTVSGDRVSIGGKDYTLTRGPDGWYASDADGKMVASWSALGGAQGDAAIASAVNGAGSGAGAGGASGALPELKTYDWSAQEQKGQDEGAASAVADTQQALAGQKASLTRTMRASGIDMSSPAAIAALAGVRRDSALALAGAANTARRQTKADSFSKRMALAGLGSTLPQQSATATNTATTAGNSAVTNTITPGQQLINNMNSSANIVGTGRSLLQNGLGGILNAQTSAFNSGGQGSGALSGIGGILGGAAQLYTAFGSSDRRLKRDIVQVGVDPGTGLVLYEFAYSADPGRRWRGVMADEVEPIYPHAVMTDDKGFKRVDYGALGIEMKEVA